MTPPTVPHVKGWEPESLRKTMVELADIVDRVDRQRIGVLEEQDALAETWAGEAASAAAERVVAECSRMGVVALEIEGLGRAFDAAAGVVEGAKTHLESLVSAAVNSGFAVGSTGIVNAEGMIALIPDTLGHEKATKVDHLRGAAANLTTDIQDALSQAEYAAADAAQLISKPTVALLESTLSNPSGRFVPGPDGSFSWKPDWPSTAAAAVIGTMTDTTGKMLTASAVASVDDVAKFVGKGLGPVGAILGTVPAIANSIEGGTDPTKAVVVEGTGTAVGLAAGAGAAWVTSAGASAVGTWIGAGAGSVVPVVGTFAGAVVGAAVGAGAGYLATKLMDAAW